jgi:hypothetical protein
VCIGEQRGEAVSQQSDRGRVGIRFDRPFRFLTRRSRKVVQFKTDGSPSIRASVLAVWGSKALENMVDLDLSFDVETEKSIVRRADNDMWVTSGVSPPDAKTTLVPS